MRTCIVTTCYLDSEERIEKTKKFIKHYSLNTLYDIYVLDNASPKEHLDRTKEYYKKDDHIIICPLEPHFDRPSHLDYKYLWRAVHKLQDLFKIYDKIIYMDNDFYMISDKMFKYVEDLNSGWTTFYSHHYNFPETGCHIITKDCQEYKNFVNMSQDEFIAKYNLQTMENILPVTHVEKGMIGDRYGEFKDKDKIDKSTIDYWAQATLEDKFT